MNNTMNACIACGGNTGSSVLKTPPLPVDTNRLWSSGEDARSAHKMEIDLTHCEHCDHLYNRTYDASLLHYEESYENSLLFSPRFLRYAEELADRLLSNYELHGKRVIEVGGGRGDFLRVLCSRGENEGMSFDPSYTPSPDEEIPPYLTFVNDYFTEKSAHHEADLILCRHVLEHLPNARDLIEMLRRSIGNRKIVVYFEVPNAEEMLRSGMIWDVIYTHCSYFTRDSLVRLFTDAGFIVHSVHEEFGGQFLAVEAGTTPLSASTGKAWNGRRTTFREEAQEFESTFTLGVERWRTQLERLAAESKRTVLWGAGAKAVTFLNLLDPSGDAISHVVDVNPRKSGRFIAGTGHEIIEPNNLKELQPSEIIVMNPAYRAEIHSMLAADGLQSEIAVA